MSNKWNLIVNKHNEYKDKDEKDIQKLWETLLGDSALFGYSKINQEIDSQRSIQIGSRQREIPDIIIKDANANKDLFVIELKQHNKDFNSSFMEQLKSYMLQLQLNVGILICKDLYVFYKDQNDFLYCQIEFKESDHNGERFIDLFLKNENNINRLSENVKIFINDVTKENNNIASIEKEIDTNIKQILYSYFENNNYSTYEIECALNKYNISVSKKEQKVSKADRKIITQKDSTNIDISIKKYYLDSDNNAHNLSENIKLEYSKPSKFIFKGNEYQVKNWTKFLVGICKILYEENPAKFIQLAENDYHKHEVCVARNKNEFRRGVEISSNIYIESNLSAINKLTAIRHLIELFGYSYEDVTYYLK